jgi:periplasmic protein TonB
MVVLFSIISIVVIVCLYDFLSSGKWQRVTSNKRNNIVFERRNKAYGAYLIRRDYNLVMTRIVLSAGAGFFLLFGGNMYANRNHSVELEDNNKNDRVIDILPPPIDDSDRIIEPLPEIKHETTTTQASTTKFIVPTVSDDEDDISDVPLNSDLVDKNIGNQDSDGDEDVFIIPDGKFIPNTNFKEPEDNNTYVQVSEMAEFPGGREAMFRFIIDNINYTPDNFDDENYGNVTVRFVVSKTGEITNATIYKAPKGCAKCIEAALKIIKKMPKWIPAKLDGKEVNSYFQIPIVFSGDE